MIFRRAIAKLRAQDWTAITIELVIVTLGVLIALAAQQWANNQSQRDQMDVSMKAVREELAVHYGYAVEYRVVYPCMRAQMDQLRDRVLSSGATLNPARLYRDEDFSFVIREPDKLYSNDAWQAAIDDGTTQRISPRMRRILAGHYGQLHEIEAISQTNNDADYGYIALTQPLPLDPTVRYSILKEIEQERGRMEYVDYLNGQVIDYIQSLGMLPPPKDAIKTTERWGTYQFCKAHGLPMRSFKDAMVAVPN
ncbi:hypothetical protein [Sphingomonas sp.]|uniref:hypothetical protein n=1 Tax=Sphingomonas sp. TaxID=28214 RepID=UPI0025D3262A|nr:hypothetical protein [Sphingomonas sp.]